MKPQIEKQLEILEARKRFIKNSDLYLSFFPNFTPMCKEVSKTKSFTSDLIIGSYSYE